MDIGKSFTYMFEEDKWVEKLLIGGLLMLVPIVNFFAIGYALRALKNVSEGKRPILPEWDDWGADWVRGLISSFVVPFIYALPLMFAAIPFIIVSLVTGTTYGGPQYGYGNVYTTGLATVCSLVFSCLAALWGLLIGIVYPSGTVRYARHGQFANYFEFRELFRFIKDNLADYIVAILISIVASIVAGIVGVIACGIGVAFTSFWSSLVMAFLFGQIEGKAPIPAPVAADPGAPAPTYGELQTSKLDAATDEILGGEPPKEG